MDTRTIVVLEGDQTGQELLEASLRVLQPDVVGFELALPRFDLSLENRRRTSNGVSRNMFPLALLTLAIMELPRS